MQDNSPSFWRTERGELVQLCSEPAKLAIPLRGQYIPMLTRVELNHSNPDRNSKSSVLFQEVSRILSSSTLVYFSVFGKGAQSSFRIQILILKKIIKGRLLWIYATRKVLVKMLGCFIPSVHCISTRCAGGADCPYKRTKDHCFWVMPNTSMSQMKAK